MGEGSSQDAGTARLYSLARALTAALTAGQVAESVFGAVFDELGANSVGLWLVDAGRIRLVAGAGLDDQLPSGVLDFGSESALPATEVVATRRPVVYHSPEERDRRWPQLCGIPSVAAAAAVLPLEVHDRVLGCLHIGFPDRMGADRFGLEFLSRLAELCAAALDRAQLHDAERERQSFLLGASAAVARAEGFSDALHRLATVAVPRLADLCLIDVSDGRDGLRRMAAVHADPGAAGPAAELERFYSPGPTGSHPAIVAMATHRSHWAAEMSEEFLRATTRDERHLELVLRLGFTSYMCVPLMAARQALGVMTLVSAGSGRRFDGSDVALAEDLASRAAAVVALARRQEQEHELAHVLQQLLLPDGLPQLEGIEIAVRYMTAHPQAEAGGDFYDVAVLPSGRVGLAIGDVEGHDAVAAATMGQLRSASRALAGQFREPGSLIDALRWSWDLLGFRRMATAIYGRVDPRSGEVVLSSAGHPPPVLVTAGGRAALSALTSSPPLGVPAGRATDQRFSLAGGDTLFFYTDGLVEERRGSIDARLGSLVECLGDSAGLPLEELCDRVLDGNSVEDRSDDVAVLAVRRCG